MKQKILVYFIPFLLLLPFAMADPDSLGVGDQLCYDNEFCYTIVDYDVYFSSINDNGTATTFTGLMNQTINDTTHNIILSIGKANVTLNQPSENTSLQFKITPPSLALTFNFSTVNFGTMPHNTTDNPATNRYKINVFASGGCSPNITFSPYNPILTKGGDTIPNSNIKFNYTSNDTYVNNTLHILTASKEILMDADSNVDLYPKYWLDVSVMQPAGSYTGSHTITGVCQ